MTYKVVIGYQNPLIRRTTLHTNLTLDQAQDICADDESSWQTCTKKYLKCRTKKRGPWFLMYFKEEQ